MISRFAFAAAVIVLTAAALCFRVPALNNRPFHGDEAVHAFKFREIWERGVYHYDPNEYHGPTLYYPSLPAVELKGRETFADTQESDYRLVTAVFGAALILLLALFRDALGRTAVLWAGLLTAVSPAFVYYSRYYIQEMLLVFFTLALLGCLWRYGKSGRIGWLIAGGAAAGLMIATKETAVLTFLAAGIAWFLTRDGSRKSAESDRREPPANRFRTTLVFAGAALITAYLFLSGFLSDARGPLRYFEAYTFWTQRARGTAIHNQPWSYYLSMLLWTHRAKGPVWSEALILGLAGIGFIAVFVRKETKVGDRDARFGRFIALYTLVLTAMYCAIPYKTPWSMLSFLNGMILLAGIGAAALVELVPGVLLKSGVTAALLIAGGQLGAQAHRTIFVYPVDGRNPYAYAQPVNDVVEMGKRVEELARVHPQGLKMPVKVYSVDEYYWPIPWYLRRLENVGYWVGLPEETGGPVIIASPEFDETLTKRLDATHLMTGYYGLRPGALMMVWVRMDLWEPYIKSRPRPVE